MNEKKEIVDEFFRNPLIIWIYMMKLLSIHLQTKLVLKFGIFCFLELLLKSFCLGFVDWKLKYMDNVYKFVDVLDMKKYYFCLRCLL